MPRLNTVDPASSTGAVKEIFDGPLNGKHLNIFKGMGNSPAALKFYLGASGALKEASLSPTEQEVVQLVFAQGNGCDYCQAAHTHVGKNAGLTEEQTVAARTNGDLGDPKLNAVNTFAWALHEKKGFVSDRDLEDFKNAGYDDGAIAETIAVAALATYTNYFNHVNQTEVDLPAAPAV
ncbi:MAG TPA: carboxymuconolactone decarboxylase family protein [Phycisphaerales bacterium]|nr:carboxymuconolactone decarboxylase family protein [Phycisphaerales bacterium]